MPRSNKKKRKASTHISPKPPWSNPDGKLDLFDTLFNLCHFSRWKHCTAAENGTLQDDQYSYV